MAHYGPPNTKKMTENGPIWAKNGKKRSTDQKYVETVKQQCMNVLFKSQVDLLSMCRRQIYIIFHGDNALPLRTIQRQRQ